MNGLKHILLIVLLISLLANDELRLNPVQEIAFPYQYDVVAWEAQNLLGKWQNRIVNLLPWVNRGTSDPRVLMEEYFSLKVEVTRLQNKIDNMYMDLDDANSQLFEIKDRRDQLVGNRIKLEADVEEVVESVVSGVLTDEDISSYNGFDYPPVDISLDELPMLLVTSPRDSISRAYEVLLRPDVTIEERESMEQSLGVHTDLSAVVLKIGGIATYPAIVSNNLDLRSTLVTTSHEWVHHYLVATLAPLGLKMNSEPKMLIINETMAAMVGQEIGDLAYHKLGGSDRTKTSISPHKSVHSDLGENVDLFDFESEMRETRLVVDDLLDMGLIVEAENYMENRRLIFVKNGYNIRKLNQAYFAFNGTYAEGPYSSSHIGFQMRSIRDAMPDLRTFLETMSRVSSYQDFMVILDRVEAQYLN